MQRVVGREGDALAELYDLYAARVFGLCLRILNENQLAEDTLQEVFLRVWQRAQLFEQSRGTVNAFGCSAVITVTFTFTFGRSFMS